MTAAANRGSARRGFASDNAATVHPEVLAAIGEANVGHAYGYGHDALTERLAERFCEHFGEQARAYPVWGGSAANILCLRAVCRPWEAAICADTGVAPGGRTIVRRRLSARTRASACVVPLPECAGAPPG